MKKLLILLGTVTMIGTSVPTVTVISLYNEKINLRASENNIQKIPLVSTNETRNRDNRWIRHSEFKLTGYFLKFGIKYEIVLNKN